MQKSELKLWLFIIVIALSSWWLNQRINQNPLAEQQEQAAHIPAFYSKKMQLITMSEQGIPEHRLIAEKTTRFLDETTELEKPNYTAYKENEMPLIMTAEKGWISTDNQEIKLFNQVVINREPLEKQRPIHIETEQLSILPKKQYAYSGLKVSAQSHQDWVVSDGIQIWFQKPQQFKFLSNVRGHYEVSY